jgi:hypothetical protein
VLQTALILAELKVMMALIMAATGRAVTVIMAPVMAVMAAFQMAGLRSLMLASLTLTSGQG